MLPLMTDTPFHVQINSTDIAAVKLKKRPARNSENTENSEGNSYSGGTRRSARKKPNTRCSLAEAESTSALSSSPSRIHFCPSVKHSHAVLRPSYSLPQVGPLAQCPSDQVCPCERCCSVAGKHR